MADDDYLDWIFEHSPSPAERGVLGYEFTPEEFCEFASLSVEEQWSWVRERGLECA